MICLDPYLFTNSLFETYLKVLFPTWLYLQQLLLSYVLKMGEVGDQAVVDPVTPLLSGSFIHLFDLLLKSHIPNFLSMVFLL